MSTKKSPATPPTPEQAQAAKFCTEAREALLHLHKTLVDSERVGYEATVGAIQSPNHFLQLLTRDPWFAWLHPVSELIVAMDETLDAEEPVTRGMVDAFLKQIGQLLVASEEGEGYAGHYHLALQRDPDVVLAHAEVARIRNRWKDSK